MRRLRFPASGQEAEALAARFLRARGIRILARNVRAGGGEIDLVAQDGHVAVIVEVRRRAAGSLAADLSVDRRKMENLRKAWRAVAHRLRLPHHLPVRIDLVLWDGDGEPVHLRGVG